MDNEHLDLPSLALHFPLRNFHESTWCLCEQLVLCFAYTVTVYVFLAVLSQFTAKFSKWHKTIAGTSAATSRDVLISLERRLPMIKLRDRRARQRERMIHGREMM